MYDVIIVGGGPTGMMLASELRLHDIDTLVLERDAEPTEMVRSLGLHMRSIEIMAMRGLLDRFLDQGQTYPLGGMFAGITKPLPRELESRHAHILGLPQPTTDRLLADRAVELGAEVRRECDVIEVHQNDENVTVELADGTRLRAAYVVGCDGGRSTVRRLLGIDFSGEPPRQEWLLVEAEVDATEDELANASTAGKPRGLLFGPAPHEAGVQRFVLTTDAPVEDRSIPPTFEDFIQRVREITGTDLGVNSARTVSRFGDGTRLAERYRVERIFLAGDAAHVHAPVGGQGLNLGLQDAINLGWKLGGRLRGWGSDELLETYETERRPVAENTLATTRAQSELVWPNGDVSAVRRLLEELMDINEVNLSLTEKTTGTGIRYDCGEGHDLLGKRMPDVELEDDWLYDRMHRGRGVLLDHPGVLAVHGWGDRVDVVSPRLAGAGRHEQLVESTLIRPDGHVAWVGEEQARLEAALTRWFGASAN